MAEIVSLRGGQPQEASEEDDADDLAFIEAVRIAEAIVFASAEPVAEAAIARKMPEGAEIGAVMAKLGSLYAGRGVNLVRVGGAWAMRTAPDLGFLLREEKTELRRLSRAALEVLAIIAYHQPVTRAEIEDVRGVATSKGTLDVLLESGWVRMRGRRRSPGRPVTYGTTPDFLDHFGLAELGDLPGAEELKGAGLLSARVPAGFTVPRAGADDDDDEDPITQMDLEELGLLAPRAGEGAEEE